MAGGVPARGRRRTRSLAGAGAAPKARGSPGGGGGGTGRCGGAAAGGGGCIGRCGGAGAAGGGGGVGRDGGAAAGEAAALDAAVPRPVEAEAVARWRGGSRWRRRRWTRRWRAAGGGGGVDAAAVRQPVEAVVLDAAERQPVAQGVPAVRSRLRRCGGLSFPSAFPFPGLSAPGPAACFAHARQSLRIASRTERSRQAARDEVWS